MAATPPDPSSSPQPTGGEPESNLRWTAFFQRSTEPIFVLSRRRQILFVNRAWETLTGLLGSDVRKRVCKRQPAPEPGSSEAVLHALSPTREVIQGQPARVRRLIVQSDAPPRWWDVEFLPLQGPRGVLGIVGRIHPLVTTSPTPSQHLPEKLVALRQRLAGWWGLEHFPTEMPAMRRIAEQVRLASRTGTAVLLVGEPGSGKEWLARTIHRESPNRENPFVALDCRHLPAAALAWLLFGTPAFSKRALATLYLKEPSLMPRELQARLCEQLTPEGDDGPGPRFMAGMSADPAAEVRAGRLLEELHCLLSPVTIQVPPLRQGLADLPLFVDRLLGRASAGREAQVMGLTEDAWELVRAYTWPGNLRELYAVLAGACRRAKGDHLEAGDLPWYLRAGATATERPLPLDKTLEQIERRLLQLAMVTAKGNKSRAAELLEIPRARLLRRIETLGLED